MKILIITQYFWPEEFLINQVALGLLSHDHEVEVLTGLPNYPSGKFFQGYSHCGPYRENYHGIPVWRTPLIPRGNSSGWRLAINYLSFALFACFRGVFAFRRPFDAILVFEVSPVTVGIPARFLKYLSKGKLFFWVQDLWPDTLSAVGAIRSELVLKWVGKLTSWIYRGCDRILIQSEAFRDSVIKCGIKKDKVLYFPNFAEDIYQPIRLQEEAPESGLIPSGFCVMFAGNIGISQDFDTILDAAKLTSINPKIQWVIIGDGRDRPWVEKEVIRRSLSNFHLLGRYPKEKMPIFFSLADVMLVSLKHERIFSMTIPSKVQAYLACGKPILASLDGEGARIIQEAKAGLTVPAESAQALAEAVLFLSALDQKSLQEMGRNALDYYKTHFSISYFLNEFERLLDN